MLYSGSTLAQVLDQFAQGGLHGVVKSSAVWLCPGEAAIQRLDTLCFGNLDGGAGTGGEVRAALGPERCSGTQAVRLGLEEAFFLLHAVGVLRVYPAPEGAQAGEEAAPDQGEPRELTAEVGGANVLDCCLIKVAVRATVAPMTTAAAGPFNLFT